MLEHDYIYLPKANRRILSEWVELLMKKFSIGSEKRELCGSTCYNIGGFREWSMYGMNGEVKT